MRDIKDFKKQNFDAIEFFYNVLDAYNYNVLISTKVKISLPKEGYYTKILLRVDDKETLLKIEDFDDGELIKVEFDNVAGFGNIDKVLYKVVDDVLSNILRCETVEEIQNIIDMYEITDYNKMYTEIICYDDLSVTPTVDFLNLKNNKEINNNININMIENFEDDLEEKITERELRSF